MKLENAAVSFGACCFVDGQFNSHQMIGYYNKSQPTPKPIYKTNRIVLGPDKADESYARFINANEVYPGIIATQCPLLGYPDGFQNTLDDVKTMILEQNISLWISLAPVVMEDDITVDSLSAMLKTHSLKCNTFPLLLMQEHGGHLELNSLKSSNSGRYWNISYTLRAFIVHDGSGSHVTLSQPDDTSTWQEIEHSVEHLWYMRWKDFDVPFPDDEALVRELAIYTAEELRGGRRVAVNCLSGRGRSGTLITIIVGFLEKSKTVTEIVDIIVGLRRSRDGLVEIPKQLRFIVRALGLGDTSPTELSSQYVAAFEAYPTQVISAFILGVVFAACIFSLAGVFLGSNRHLKVSNARLEESKVNGAREKEPLLGLKSQ